MRDRWDLSPIVYYHGSEKKKSLTFLRMCRYRLLLNVTAHLFFITNYHC